MQPSRPELQTWLATLYGASPMAIGFSRDGVTLDANRAYVKLFGCASVEDLRGHSILDQIAPSHRTRVADIVAKRARGDPLPERYETRGLRRDGTEFPIDVTTTRVLVADGPITIAFITDVSERDDALVALRASEERFRTLASAAVEGIFVHANGKIVLVNEAGARMFGCDPASMTGASLMDFAAVESRTVVAEHIRSDATDMYEAIALRKDGSTFVAEVRGRTLLHENPPARVSIIRDATDRKRAEAEQHALAERVRHAQKLATLGVLAGGIAHDFNNILTVIVNGVALAKHDPSVGAATVTQLDSIALAAERAADLCQQMLAYAGKAAFAREAVALSTLVAEMSSMLEVSIAKKATLVRELSGTLPPMLGDPTQIRQVVMNLVINASEAMGGANGTVRVSTGAGTFGADTFKRSAAGGDPKPGPYVWLEVRDDGKGMDAATMAQMFDPFFSTKFAGRGLGMAAVLGIVRGHAGAIEVESAPGEGTRIRVYFPASAAAPVHREAARATKLKGRGVVLVVDDERGVREVTRLLLRDLGFEVIVASDGVEATEIFRTEASRIGAVLLDRTMPRMDGAETLRELRRLDPSVPIVLTSGYGAASAEGASPLDAVPNATLDKPYSTEQLLAVLREVIRQ